MLQTQPELSDASDIVFVDGTWAVLIAEDNPGCRARLQAALACYTFPIALTVVSKADELLTALASNAYDLAFVDIGLGPHPDWMLFAPLASAVWGHL